MKLVLILSSFFAIKQTTAMWWLPFVINDILPGLDTKKSKDGNSTVNKCADPNTFKYANLIEDEYNYYSDWKFYEPDNVWYMSLKEDVSWYTAKSKCYYLFNGVNTTLAKLKIEILFSIDNNCTIFTYDNFSFFIDRNTIKFLNTNLREPNTSVWVGGYDKMSFLKKFLKNQ